MKVAITGSSGFVGKNLVDWLKSKDHEVILFDRKSSDFKSQLIDVDAVVHTAALVHKFDPPPYEEYFRSNVQLSLEIAKAAEEMGVKKFIFLSTIKVFGEEREEAISESTPLEPMDSYSKSKLEAERKLSEFYGTKNGHLIILRPPLIYGPGVKANLKALISLISTSLPLPFKHKANKRSLIYVKNLTDLIENVITNENIKSDDFLVSDYSVSLFELVTQIKETIGSRTFVFRLPLFVIKCIFIFSFQKKKFHRLFGSLYVDDRKIRNQLNWRPPFKFSQALGETINGVNSK